MEQFTGSASLVAFILKGGQSDSVELLSLCASPQFVFIDASLFSSLKVVDF